MHGATIRFKAPRILNFARQMLLRRWRIRPVLSLQKKAGVDRILIKPIVVVDTDVRKEKAPTLHCWESNSGLQICRFW